MAVSCKRDETLSFASKYEDIRFSVCDSILTSGSIETKAMENEITCDITDWEYVEDSTATKASLTQTLTGATGVFGYNFTTWGSTVTPTVMYNMKHTVDAGSLNPESKVLWKTYSSGSLRFYAYAPYGKFTLSSSSTGGVPYLTFTVPTTNKDQIDVLYAQSEDVPYTNRDAVPLQFKHAMTAVQFRLGIDGATLKSVTVSGVYSKGKLSLDGTWSEQATTASYSVTSADSLLILVPQTVPSGAKISLTYNDGKNNNTIEASIAGQVWTAGKKVVYTLKKKGEETKYYYFDLYLGNVILTAESGANCSGYVNIGGTPTKVEVPHSNTNKYYIYQSYTTSKTDAIHAKIRTAVTGFNTKSEWENGSNVKLPVYESDPFFSSHKNSTYMDGKTDWAEFITNNPDPEKVRTAWNNADQIYPTINRIMICGNETEPTDFDVTIADLSSGFFPYNQSNQEDGIQPSLNGRDKMGAITIGESDPDAYSTTHFKNYHTERVTLRLKGKNMLGRISYTKPHNSDLAEFEHKEAHTGDNRSFLKITSFDGDGSTNGSLSVTLNNANNKNPRSPYGSLCSLIGSGNSDIDNEKEYGEGVGMISRQMTDFFINGGNVYVGTKSLNGSVFSNYNYLIGCIGGTNSESHITINGGILTAVSNTTAPALGGGGGWQGKGGKGVIDINGGSVYAYTFGVKGSYDGKTNYLSPTAIGGGSTMGEVDGSVGAPCVIKIKGGNVYAESRGGVAIGGGMSGRHAGGDCDIEITGGIVRAISKSGTIVDSTVIFANAIGGGRSGTEDGDGGTAIMKISGGIITSGSVGGGKAGRTEGKIGSANIEISGGETSAQFIMARGATEDPLFKMTAGTIRSSSTSDTEYQKVQKYGGAVYMESGICSIEGGTISKCSATLGGAVYMNGGTFNITGSGKISDCTSAKDGGAVFIEGGSATVSGGEIYHNIASKGNGGGVYIKGGNFTMTGGKINNNTSDSNMEASSFYGGNGGGIYVSSSTSDPVVSISGGEITYNSADRNGGGLCVDMSDAGGHKATITIGNEDVDKRDILSPDIRLNSAALSGGGMAVQGNGSNITIYSGTVKGNVSAFVKNEDIRNDGGTVELVGKNEEGKEPQVNVQYNTITFYANNGNDPEPYDEQRVITSTNSLLKPTETALAFELEFYHIASWNTKRDGTGTRYTADGRDPNTGRSATMNITSDVSLYAQWVANQ